MSLMAANEESDPSAILNGFWVTLVKVDSQLKSIDIMHFGWNIGKAFGRKRIHTATFIKNVFAHTLCDVEISTIERKMSHSESQCKLKLCKSIIT